MLVFVTFIYGVVYLVMAKGIKVSGKVAIITVLGPYVFLTILFLRVVWLPGCWEGIQYMLFPDFGKLLKWEVWQTALNQCFFQNNIGFGTIMTFASFRNSRLKVYATTKWLIALNVLSGILAALIVFGYIGYFSNSTGISIEDLPLSGPSLIFITYPASLALMPFPRFWMCLFFLTMIFLGVDTLLANLEVPSYALIDFKNSRRASNQINTSHTNMELKEVNSEALLENKPTQLIYVPGLLNKMSDESIRFGVCLFAFSSGLVYCFQSGFRLIGYVNTFCTVFSTSIGLILDVIIFYFTGHFRNTQTKLHHLSRETSSPIIHFCLKYLAIPLTLLIFLVWVPTLPSSFAIILENGDLVALAFLLFATILINSPTLLTLIFN